MSSDELGDVPARRLRRAVQLLVGALHRAGQPCSERVLPVDELSRGAVTVVMRVLVLFVAERRRLLPARPGGSIHALATELERSAPVPGAAWTDLFELFTAAHDRICGRRPAAGEGAAGEGAIGEGAIGGGAAALFDPAAHPWLRHRVVEDVTVLRLLQAVRSGLATDRTVEVEQVGHGYEQLLAVAAVRADTVLVALAGAPGRERHVPLAELTTLADAHPDRHTLGRALITTYASARLGTAASVARRLTPLDPVESGTARVALLGATDGDPKLTERLLPFARLIRSDLAGRPLVTLPGAPYLTGSPLRRRTGTHYTPPALAADVVRHALEPLLYRVGPLQTADRARWSPRSSVELLELRVADIAMGAGAFLIAAARYLGDALLAARVREGTAAPVRADRAAAYREVVERCLYGVDVNPTAVRVATASLWLLAAAPDRPGPVLDGRLLVGDSLLGIVDRAQPARLLDDTSVTADSPDLARSWLVADLAVGAALAGRVRIRRRSAGGPGSAADVVYRDRRAARAREAATLAHRVHAGDPDEALRRSRHWLSTDQVPDAFERRPLHWPLAFPEVFTHGGFDAVVGNPPFLGGQKLTAALGRAYRELLVDTVGRGTRGSADLVAYFVLRAQDVLRPGGQAGLLGTNTLAQGDTREVGLEQLVAGGVTIRRAVRSERWPAAGAKLEYCAVWTSRTPLAPGVAACLGERAVPAITAALEPAEQVRAGPFRLAENARRCYIGSYVLGLGFLVPPERAAALLTAEPRNADVLLPYLSGRDLNADPAATASRWVINFWDWPEQRARRYPDCYQQVRELVRPERERNNRAVYRRYWWQYGEKRPALLAAIAGLPRVIVIALVSRTVMPVLVPTGQVLSHKLGVFASDDPALLAVLSAGPHYWWTRSHSSTIKADTNYCPSDVFETLPLPELTPELRGLGHRLDECRRRLMEQRRTGLTATYNLVFDPAVHAADIAALRGLHRAVDRATVRAYGWPDLVDRLDHGFHPAGRAVRYTIGPAAQRAVLDRLLTLNHERHRAEPGQDKSLVGTTRSSR